MFEFAHDSTVEKKKQTMRSIKESKCFSSVLFFGCNTSSCEPNPENHHILWYELTTYLILIRLLFDFVPKKILIKA